MHPRVMRLHAQHIHPPHTTYRRIVASGVKRRRALHRARAVTAKHAQLQSCHQPRGKSCHPRSVRSLAVEGLAEDLAIAAGDSDGDARTRSSAEPAGPGRTGPHVIRPPRLEIGAGERLAPTVAHSRQGVGLGGGPRAIRVQVAVHSVRRDGEATKRGGDQGEERDLHDDGGGRRARC
jgi:hypothetical protein